MLLPQVGLLIFRVGLGLGHLDHALPRFWHRKSAFFTFISICELLGSIAIIAGFLTQLAALGLIIILLGAIFLHIAKWKQGFRGGWEPAYLYLIGYLLLIFLGAGAWSFDGMLGLGF